MLSCSRCNDTFSLQDNKNYRIRFRVKWDLLPGFKADENDIRPCGFHQIFFDRALAGAFRCFQEVHYFYTVLRSSSILRSIPFSRIFSRVFIASSILISSSALRVPVQQHSLKLSDDSLHTCRHIVNLPLNCLCFYYH